VRSEEVLSSSAVLPPLSFVLERKRNTRAERSHFPFSTFMSIFTTSAMRRSRSDAAAISTARRPASSQEVSLTPTTSTIR
jgi:hypothetical protein